MYGSINLPWPPSVVYNISCSFQLSQSLNWVNVCGNMLGKIEVVSWVFWVLFLILLDTTLSECMYVSLIIFMYDLLFASAVMH